MSTLPAEEVIIWRYMDLAKLIDMLRTKSLYLARRDTLGDRFEGSIPRWLGAKMRASLAEFGRDFERDFEIESPITETTLQEVGQEQRLGLFANCWHQSQNESMAMWKLYGSGSQCIAIESTVADLRASISPKQFPVEIVPVEYLPWYSERWERVISNPSLQIKHISFEHEKEVRVLLDLSKVNLPEAFSRETTGVPLEIDLKRMIRRVHIGPETPAFFRTAVCEIIQNYIKDFPLHGFVDSRMAGDPHFG